MDTFEHNDIADLRFFIDLLSVNINRVAGHRRTVSGIPFHIFYDFQTLDTVLQMALHGRTHLRMLLHIVLHFLGGIGSDDLAFKQGAVIDKLRTLGIVVQLPRTLLVDEELTGTVSGIFLGLQLHLQLGLCFDGVFDLRCDHSLQHIHGQLRNILLGKCTGILNAGSLLRIHHTVKVVQTQQCFRFADDLRHLPHFPQQGDDLIIGIGIDIAALEIVVHQKLIDLFLHCRSVGASHLPVHGPFQLFIFPQQCLIEGPVHGVGLTVLILNIQLHGNDATGIPCQISGLEGSLQTGLFPLAQILISAGTAHILFKGHFIGDGRILML